MGNGNIKQTQSHNSVNLTNLTRSTRLTNSVISVKSANLANSTILSDCKIDSILITDIIKMIENWCEVHCIFKLVGNQYHFLIKTKNNVKFYNNYNQKSCDLKCIEINKNVNADGLTKIFVTELAELSDKLTDKSKYIKTPIEIVKFDEKIYVGDCMIIKFNSFDTVITNKSSEIVKFDESDEFGVANELSRFEKMSIVQEYMECLSNKIILNGFFTGTLGQSEMFPDSLYELYQKQNSDMIENTYQFTKN